ncbi:hypothetical protein D3C75_1266680 [compost metagenome]
MAVRTGLAADMRRLGSQQRLLPAEQPDEKRQGKREQEPAQQRTTGGGQARRIRHCNHPDSDMGAVRPMLPSRPAGEQAWRTIAALSR